MWGLTRHATSPNIRPMAMAEIVPADLLVPPDAHARGFCHDDAALVLDGYLRRLARQEARCRAILGRLAHRFLQRRGREILGFARLGDHARERLGLSARELQSLATVAERAARLPELDAAFARGELSWAQLRMLATVASPETEGEWLKLARGRTVRALAALVRAEGAADEEAEDGEPRVQLRLRCPRRLVRLWRDAVELARRMAGAELTQAQAAETIAAEGLSARPPVGDSWPEAWPPAGRLPIPRRAALRSPPISTGRPSPRRSRTTWRSSPSGRTTSTPSPSTSVCERSCRRCSVSTGRWDGCCACSSIGGSTGRCCFRLRPAT